MSEGAERIRVERLRQISEEHYDAAHDDAHTAGELAMAAACYAAPERIFVYEPSAGSDSMHFANPWPWDADDDRRSFAGHARLESGGNRIRLLVKAGALIAAEIDRLLRAAERGP